MCQGLSEPDFYGDLAYKLKKIVGSNNFSAQFIKIISHYKKIGYNINVLQQTACLVAGIQFGIGHSPKKVPDVREFAVQLDSLSETNFIKKARCTVMHSDAILNSIFVLKKQSLIGQIHVSFRLVCLFFTPQILFH